MLNGPYLARTTTNGRSDMANKTPRPYADRGKRLRERRKELVAAGKLQSSLVKLAEAVEVSVSGFQQWERGETWPRNEKRAKLAELMRWSEQELDHGPQEAKGQEMSSHPISTEELEILALYRGFEEERPEIKRWLIAKLHTRHALKQEVRGPLRTVADHDVEARMPVTTGLKGQGSKKAQKR